MALIERIPDKEEPMTYLQLAYAHLATVAPAFGIGTYLMVRRKGTAHHRRLGRTYLVLMLATALITLAMGAEIGPRFSGISAISMPSACSRWSACRSPISLRAAAR
ncbi:hypothetical protein ACFSHR_18515 [Azotobacter chroococcum]